MIVEMANIGDAGLPLLIFPSDYKPPPDMDVHQFSSGF